MDQLNALEKGVLAKLAEGDDPSLAALREQIETAVVAKRTLTGVGFLTEVKVSPSTARLAPRGRIRFGDVLANVPGLQHGAGFVLYIDAGAITALEGYSFGEAWPSDVTGFTLYFSKPERDLRDLGIETGG